VRLPRWVWWIAILVIQVTLFHKVRYDDAYITYRYGQNLVLGNGLVFNPGDRVLGTTAPGHALASALIYAIVGEDALPGAMSVLGCLAWTLQAGLLFRLLSERLPKVHAIAIACAIALGAAQSARWVALETHWAMALALAALLAALEGKHYLAAVLAAAAGWFRPDAYMVMLPCWLLTLRTAPKKALLTPVPFVALLASWVLFATAYYGSPLPQSAIVKFHGTDFWKYAWHLITYLPKQSLPFPSDGTALLPMWALAVFGGFCLARTDRRLLVIPGYGIMHTVAYLVLRPPLHPWHLYPQLLVFVALCMVALCDLVVRIANLSSVKWRAAVHTGLIGLALGGYAINTSRFAWGYEQAFWRGQRDRIYRLVAADLAQRASPGELTGAEEVGTIAYYSRAFMVDHPGLIFRNPMSLYEKFHRGEPTQLRFLLANSADLAKTQVIYGNRAPERVFELGAWRLWLFDLNTINPEQPTWRPSPRRPQSTDN
jgi:hypothetical protein